MYAYAHVPACACVCVMAASIVCYSTEELNEFLFRELDADIVNALSKNKIGGEEFMALTDLEMFPVISERVKVRKLIAGNSEKIQAQVRLRRSKCILVKNRSMFVAGPFLSF